VEKVSGNGGRKVNHSLLCRIHFSNGEKQVPDPTLVSEEGVGLKERRKNRDCHSTIRLYEGKAGWVRGQ